MDTVWELHDRMFDENDLKKVVLNAAKTSGWEEVPPVLAFAEECHRGQLRKGRERVPFFYHPLMTAAHAIWLGLGSSDLVCACLLHDVCEDCGVLPEELPASHRVRDAVALVTKKGYLDYHKEDIDREYYGTIAGSPLASLVKVLDRCNNLSQMASSFSERRMREYAEETERFVLPLLDILEKELPERMHAFSLLRYHFQSVLTALGRLFEETGE